MATSEASRKGWEKRVPSGYATLSDAARAIGRDISTVRRYAIDLGVLKINGKGQPSLVKTSDLEGLKEVMKEVPFSTKQTKPRVKALEPEPPAPKWTEPVLLAPSPEKEFEQAVRKVLHLMEKLGIDSLTMQDGKAEILRTVSVTKKEEIKG